MLTAGYASGAAVGKFPFDRHNTFGFVSMVCAYPFVYAVPKDSPIQSFPDMLTRAKANPGKLTYVITSLGSVYHLIGKWVGHAGRHRDGAGVLPRLGCRGHRRAGRPRRRDARHRDLGLSAHPQRPVPRARGDLADPLRAAAGRADGGRDACRACSYMSWLGLAAAPQTPRPIVERLNAELHRALALPDVQQKLKEGGNIATPTTPEAMGQQIEDEIANWKRLIVAGTDQGRVRLSVAGLAPAKRGCLTSAPIAKRPSAA